MWQKIVSNGADVLFKQSVPYTGRPGGATVTYFLSLGNKHTS